MYRAIILTLPLTVLAACSGTPADQLQAGQWDYVLTVTGFDRGELPDDMLTEMVERRVDEPQPISRCLSSADAEMPLQRLIEGYELGVCNYRDTRFTGGVIDIEASCSRLPPSGGSPTFVTMEGSFTETSIEGDIEIHMEGEPVGSGMQMSVRIDGERIGDCTP